MEATIYYQGIEFIVNYDYTPSESSTGSTAQVIINSFESVEQITLTDDLLIELISINEHFEEKIIEIERGY